MKAVIGVLIFFLKHMAFTFLLTLCACTAWTVLYFLLMVIAIVIGSGLGGVFAYPVGLLLIALVCLLPGLLIFGPATACGKAFCKLSRLPEICAIPVVWIVAITISLIPCIEFFTPELTVGDIMIRTVLCVSIPLGAYWWLTEGLSVLRDSGRRILSYRKG